LKEHFPVWLRFDSCFFSFMVNRPIFARNCLAQGHSFRSMYLRANRPLCFVAHSIWSRWLRTITHSDYLLRTDKVFLLVYSRLNTHKKKEKTIILSFSNNNAFEWFVAYFNLVEPLLKLLKLRSKLALALRVGVWFSGVLFIDKFEFTIVFSLFYSNWLENKRKEEFWIRLFCCFLLDGVLRGDARLAFLLLELLLP